MKCIYLSSTYAQMLEMRKVAERLRSAGHKISSRWIDGDEEGQSRESAALMNVTDMDYADTIMSFSLPPKTYHVAGGRHVEFGYAYAHGKRLIFIGQKGEHIFHFLPTVEHYDTLEQAMVALDEKT